MKRTNFYILLAATDISLFGSLLTSFSIPILIYSFFYSGIILAVFELAGLIPSISLGIYIGIWMKNKNAKVLWILSSICLSLMSFFAFLYPTIWTFFILNIISSSIGVISLISYQSMLTEIVKKEDLSWANSTLSLSMSIVALVSPLTAAYLLDIYIGFPFLIDAVAFLIAAFVIYIIPVSSKISEYDTKEKFSDIFKSALNFINKKKSVRNTVILFLSTSLIGGGLKIANVAYFSSFSSYYMVLGLAMVFSYMGDILVKWAISVKFVKIENPYRAVILSPLFYIFSFFFLFAIKDLYIDMVAFFFLGMGNGLLSPNRLAVIQKETPRQHLTSILGLMSTLGDTFRIVSVILFGIAVSYLSAQIVYGLIAVFLLIVFVFFYPSVRENGESHR